MRDESETCLPDSASDSAGMTVSPAQPVLPHAATRARLRRERNRLLLGYFWGSSGGRCSQMEGEFARNPLC